MRTIIIALVLAIAAPAAAQEPTPLKWSVANRDVAGRISDGLVAGQLAIDAIHSWRSADRSRAFACQAMRLGFTLGAAQLTKRIVHRERPDQSDHKSFFSGHTATAMASAGWRFQVGVPIALGAGYFRMAANRHYATDVAAGATVGFFSNYLFCERP